MWKYIRQYLFFAIVAGLFMICEVLMDLIQPGIMSRIVDEGVLGVYSGGIPNLHLIWMLGLQMIGLVLFGGLCGSLNNVFVHISSQNIGNEIRKDCRHSLMPSTPLCRRMYPVFVSLRRASGKYMKNCALG